MSKRLIRLLRALAAKSNRTERDWKLIVRPQKGRLHGEPWALRSGWATPELDFWQLPLGRLTLRQRLLYHCISAAILPSIKYPSGPKVWAIGLDNVLLPAWSLQQQTAIIENILYNPILLDNVRIEFTFW